MIDIRVTGLQDLQREFKDFSERRLRASIATALTRTAVTMRNELLGQLSQAFDRPTPYTLRQLRYVGATAQRLAAGVGFNVVAITDERGSVMRYADLGPGETPAGRYLTPNIEGGVRRMKRFEKALQAVGVLPMGWKAVPGQRAKMTPFGNQSVGEIRQILSYFDAAELVAGSRQNMGTAGRARLAKGTRKGAGFEYFVVKEGDRRTFTRASGKSGTKKMQPGIYRRTAFALGTRIEPVIIFVREVTYRRRWDFYAQARAIADRELPAQLDRALAESLQRLRARSAGRG